MLRLPPFEYLAPTTVAEAAQLLAENHSDTILVAGGTDVYPGMKRRIFEPKRLVSLRGIAALRTVEDQDGLLLGAGRTLAEIAANPMIAARYPALTRAALFVATPQLRNMGTIGGNLCVDTRCTYYNQSESWRQALGYCMKKDGHICWVAPGSSRCLAVQSSDTAPVLIALDARVRLVSSTSDRWIPIHALYNNDGINYLAKEPTEILTQIHIPVQPGTLMTYEKLRRRGAFDFPVLSVAVTIRQEEDGTCTDASVVLGAVGSAPLRARQAESILIGARVTEDVIQEAAKQAYRPAKPLDNTDMDLSYRKQMARVYVARALRKVSRLS